MGGGGRLGRDDLVVRVRVKENRIYTRFRRGGRTYTTEWTEVDPKDLTADQLADLTSADTARWLEVEGVPAKVAAKIAEPGTPKEAVVAAAAAGVKLPGAPTPAEAEIVTREDRAEAETPRRRPRRSEE